MLFCVLFSVRSLFVMLVFGLLLLSVLVLFEEFFSGTAELDFLEFGEVEDEDDVGCF